MMTYYRKLFSFDAPSIERHLLALAPGDRRHRFHGLISDGFIHAYVQGMDWHGRMLIGAVENGELIGLAEAVLTEAVVEIAVSVDGAHQGHGLGGRLVELAQRAAAMLGATSAILYFEIDNPRIPRIARHLGGKVDVSTEEALLSVPAAKPFAWWSELFESAAALAECKIESASEMTRTAATPVPSEALGIPLATTAD